MDPLDDIVAAAVEGLDTPAPTCFGYVVPSLRWNLEALLPLLWWIHLVLLHVVSSRDGSKRTRLGGIAKFDQLVSRLPNMTNWRYIP